MFKGKRFSLSGNWAVMFLICFAISALSILLISLCFALVANTSSDPTGNLGIFSLISLILGGAIGGFSSAKIKKESAVLFSVLVALAITLVMLIICIILSGKVSGAALMNYACYVGVSTLSSIIGAREKKRGHHKR